MNKSSIGSFILIKNEAKWIGPHLASWLPHLDQMVFFDGNSTDGTLDIINSFKKTKDGHKIKLVLDKDPKNLREDYVKLFDECLHSLDTDYAFFLHPDMICEDIGDIKNIGDSITYSTTMRSFAGEPDGDLLEITGRCDKWKNIYRLRNPDLGLHYHGFYGADNEDCYFREITGNSHEFYGPMVNLYPYAVVDSKMRILHFSDVRTHERRISRMAECFVNAGYTREEGREIASKHPRVTLKSNGFINFTKCEYPEIFKTWQQEIYAKT